MYSNTLVSGTWRISSEFVLESDRLAWLLLFATLVPPKAKKRNMNVPANSASAATERLCQLCEMSVVRTLVPLWPCVMDSMWCLPWELLG